jgi:hypothetical protein
VEFKNLFFQPDPEVKNTTLVLGAPSLLYETEHQEMEQVFLNLKSDPEAVKTLRDSIRKASSMFCRGSIG